MSATACIECEEKENHILKLEQAIRTWDDAEKRISFDAFACSDSPTRRKLVDLRDLAREEARRLVK